MDIIDFLFLVFFPVATCLFRKAGSKTRQKSSIAQKISVILSLGIISRICFSILIFRTLIYKIFCFFYVKITDFLYRTQVIIVSFNKPNKALEQYKQRWQIEMCFKAMKSSGFDIENTHLQDIGRIEKLILLVMLAFVWCYKVGIYLHLISAIKIKKHGRLAKSIFKYGLDYIASVLLNPVNQNNINITRFLSCT